MAHETGEQDDDVFRRRPFFIIILRWRPRRMRHHSGVSAHNRAYIFRGSHFLSPATCVLIDEPCASLCLWCQMCQLRLLRSLTEPVCPAISNRYRFILIPLLYHLQGLINLITLKVKSTTPLNKQHNLSYH